MKLFEVGKYNVPRAECVNADMFIAGVECEIEDVKHVPKSAYFNVDKDGSLRGHGYEFISKPLLENELLHAFDGLHKALTFHGESDPFSFRTSTHVHVNCLALDPEQIRNIILMYALFEEFFFAMAKPERRDNIHCVPLTETHLPGVYPRDLHGMLDRWSKYTALNLKRIPDLGTLEFRHMHGTGKLAEFAQWIGVLKALYLLGQDVTLTPQNLSNKEEIVQWFEIVFAGAPNILMLKPSLFDIIRNNLIDVKFAV
jgi:hypothetical protein